MSFFLAIYFSRSGVIKRNHNNTRTQNPVAQGQGQQAAPTRPAELKIAKPSTDEHWRGAQERAMCGSNTQIWNAPSARKFTLICRSFLAHTMAKSPGSSGHFPLTFIPKLKNLPKQSNALQHKEEMNPFGNGWFNIWKNPDLELVDLPGLATQVGLDETTFKQAMRVDNKKRK